LTADRLLLTAYCLLPTILSLLLSTAAGSRVFTDSVTALWATAPVPWVIVHV